MKLWLISQNENQDHDTFDRAVVIAETEEAARHTHPYGDCTWNGSAWDEDDGGRDRGTWSHPKHVAVEYIGETEREAGVVLASFNAG